MSIKEFVNYNSEFCMSVVIVAGIVSLVLGCMSIYTRQLRIRCENGYIEVQSQGTTSTHWEKAPHK